MRPTITTSIILTASILGSLVSCSKGDGETGETGEAPPECLEDAQCDGFEICEIEECIVGDRDNSPDEATTLLWDNDTPGTIQEAGDVDYFTFNADGGEFVRIATATAGSELTDTIVTLYTPSGKVHQIEDEHPVGSVLDNDTILYAYLPEGGAWFLAVEDVNGAGATNADYVVSVTEVGGASSETDSMESPAYSFEATRSNSYWAIGVVLEEDGDTDWIEVTLPWDDCPVYVYGSTYVAGTDANPTVELVNSDGETIARKEGLGPDGTAVYPEVSGGKIYIAASDSHGGGGDSHWFFVYFAIGDSGSVYELETEPNDTMEEANELEVNWTTATDGNVYGYSQGWGMMDWSDDEDWFWFQGKVDHYLQLWGSSADLGSSFGPEVTVYDPDGQEISTGSGESFPDASNVGPLLDGHYMIRVRNPAPQEGDEGPAWYYRFTGYQTDYTVSE